MFNNKFTKKDPIADAALKILESWDDDEDDDVRRADAELKRMKAKPIEADKKTDPDKEIGKLAKKTPKEVDEEVVSEDKWSDIADGPWKKSKLKTKQQYASAAANAAGKGLKGAQHKLDVAEPKGKLTAADFKKLRKEDAEQIDELSRDLVQRYIRKTKPEYSSPSEIKKREGGRSLALKKAYGDKKFGLPEPKVKATQETNIQEKTLTPAESKKKEEIVKSMKKGASGFKERYGKRAKEVMYATATKQAKKVAEEIESVDEKVKVKVSTDKPIGYKVSDIGPGKKEHNVKTNKAWDDAQKKKTVSEAQGPTSTYSSDTFVQNANTSSNPSPLSRAKELARSAMSRMKNEMLGKAGTTSEEIDPNVRSTDTLKGRVAGGKKDVVGPGSDGKSSKVKYTPGPK